MGGKISLFRDSAKARRPVVIVCAYVRQRVSEREGIMFNNVLLSRCFRGGANPNTSCYLRLLSRLPVPNTDTPALRSWLCTDWGLLVVLQYQRVVVGVVEGTESNVGSS